MPGTGNADGSFSFTCTDSTQHLSLVLVTEGSVPSYNDGPLQYARFDALAQATEIDVLLEVSIDTGDPLWADLLLLHSGKSIKSDSSQPIDFDWMFGLHQDEADLNKATSPETLLTLPEAQARIIGLSAAIPVIQKS